MSNLVRNPKDRFSHDRAHILITQVNMLSKRLNVDKKYRNSDFNCKLSIGDNLQSITVFLQGLDILVCKFRGFSIAACPVW